MVTLNVPLKTAGEAVVEEDQRTATAGHRDRAGVAGEDRAGAAGAEAHVRGGDPHHLHAAGKRDLLELEVAVERRALRDRGDGEVDARREEAEVRAAGKDQMLGAGADVKGLVDVVVIVLIARPTVALKLTPAVELPKLKATGTSNSAATPSSLTKMFPCAPPMWKIDGSPTSKLRFVTTILITRERFVRVVDSKETCAESVRPNAPSVTSPSAWRSSPAQLAVPPRRMVVVSLVGTSMKRVREIHEVARSLEPLTSITRFEPDTVTPKVLMKSTLSDGRLQRVVAER